MSELSPLCRKLLGKDVVIDVASMYVYLGRLTESDEHFLTLENADVHDLRDTSTSRERYVLDSVTHGIRVNRNRVHVRWGDVVSLSALDDIVE